jgi:hypothetical protein
MAEWPDMAPFDPAPETSDKEAAEEATVSTPLSNGGILVAFLNHFLGPDAPTVHDAEPIPQSALAGAYRHEYRAYGTIAELLDVLSAATSVIEVSGGDDGLTINGRGPYRPVGGNVYWNGEYETPLEGHFVETPIWAFSKDAVTGEIYASPRLAIDPFVKTGALENPALYASILPPMLLIFVTGFAAFFWRTQRIALGAIARPAAIAAAALIFAEAAALLLRWNGETLLGDFLMGGPGRFMALAFGATLIALCSAVFIAAFMANAARFVRGGNAGLLETIDLALLAAAGVGALLFVSVFHLLGWQAP